LRFIFLLKHVFTSLFSIVVIFTSTAALCETKISGFASMFAGIASKGDQFLADYPNTGLYDDDISFAPDSSFGVQLKTRSSDKLEFIIQLISHGAHEFQNEIDWAYINYNIDSELSLQMGRKRLPLYFYSDFYDLGFAYYWVRPPSDNYTWQITNYNGLSLVYEPELGHWDASFNLYLGREDDKENHLLTFLASNTPVDESWKNIIGFVAELSDDIFEYRFTIMFSQLHRQVGNIVLSDDVGQLFYGFSFNARIDQFTFLSELNHYERSNDNIFVDTSMFSFGYKVGKTIPHITYSNLKQKQRAGNGDEHHYTVSIGARHNLNKTTALKMQYDDTTDKGVTTPVVGDGKLLSFGVDFIF